jgi:hypothetical protein
MADQYEDDKLKPQNTVQAQPNPVQSRRMQVGQQQPKATGFTNIQRVIGASQGNRLGSTVAGGVRQAGQQAQSALEKSREEFQKGLSQSNLATEENQAAASGLIQRAGQGQIGDEDLSQAQKFREGQFTGPTQIENASRLGMQASSAESLGRLGTSEGGRQALLQKFVGRPGYAAGQQKLDTLLLGQDREAVNAARAATAGLTSQATRAIESAAAQAQTTAQANKDFAERFKTDVGGNISNVDTAAQSAFEQAKQSEGQRKTAFESLANNLLGTFKPTLRSSEIVANRNARENLIKSSGLPPEMQDKLRQAMSATSGEARKTLLQNVLGDYQESGNLAKETVMSQDQAKSFSALNKLLGRDVDVSKAGTFQAGSGSLRTNVADSAINMANQLKAAQQFAQTHSPEDFESIASGRSKPSAQVLNVALTPEERKEYEFLSTKSNYSTKNKNRDAGADRARYEELTQKARNKASQIASQSRQSAQTAAELQARLNRGEY